MGQDRLFVGKNHPLYSFMKELYETDGLDTYEEGADINPSLTKGMAGKIWKDKLCSWNTK